jgi:predicted DNA-binding protein (UPF0251 family)
MARPRIYRHISSITPKVNYFFPEGIDKQAAKTIYLTAEEIEALRLRHDLSFKQTEAADEMEISQTTYSRILTFAYEKLTQALLHGHAIALQTHRFNQGCPMDLPRRRCHRNHKSWVRNQRNIPPQLTKSPSLTQFKGWGCSDCGYIWKDVSTVPIKPFVKGNPECSEYSRIKPIASSRNSLREDKCGGEGIGIQKYIMLISHYYDQNTLS